MGAKLPIFSAIVAVSLVLDQVTKLYIDRSMHLYQSIPVIDGLFSITYVRNKGAAFSFLASSPWRLPFFICITIVALVAILISLRKLRADQRLALVSLSLIFSGAAGNLIDRVRLGEVIDFLDVYWQSPPWQNYPWHWPAFNVADSAICVGVALLALDMLREERRAKRSAGQG